MHIISASVLGICLLSVAVSLSLLICPDTALKKQIRFLVALLYLPALLQPVKILQIPDSLESVQKAQNDQTVQNLTEQAVRQAVFQLLAQQNISCSDLHIILHIDDQNCISISEVSLTCDDYQNTVRLLREAFGEEVTLHVSEILG